MKNILRNFFIFLRLDVTKNIKYDRLTRKIIEKYLQKNHNCVDVGCHQGEIMDLFLFYAPQGKHAAFEPLPHLFNGLKQKYSNKVDVYPFALSSNNGTTQFQFVKNAPAYSGIKKRKYALDKPDIEEIQVEMKKMDDVLSESAPVHFIKIDVEGAEFDVLKGAKNTLLKNKPLVLFEYGKGAGDYYGTQPHEVYAYLSDEIGLEVFLLSDFIEKKKPMSETQFVACYNNNRDYYFIAAPSN